MSKPVVITGQQIGLLGGPLYTTYKILSAVSLAQELAGTAVFWLETNDADFSEINHFTFIDKHNKLKTLQWDIDSGGRSCGMVPIDPALTAIIETFFDMLRPTEYTDALRTTVLDCYREGRLLGEASFMLAESIFGQLGLTLFDPSAETFLSEIRPILEHEIEATPTGQQCHAFIRIGDRRLPLFKTDSGVQLRNGDPVDLDDGQLLPDVHTRNVCQDAYFNAHTYVAGPGEVSYIETLDPWYKRHNVKKAAVQPRMSAVLIEPRTRRLLDRSRLSPESVASASKVELVKAVRRTTGGVDIDFLGERIDFLTQQYLDECKALGLDAPPLRKALLKATKDALGKKRATVNRMISDALNDAAELSDRIRPLDKPQERVFNLFYYMNLYGGADFVGWLMNRHRFEKQILEITHA